VVPVVAMVGVAGAEMMVVPISPTVGTIPFPKGVSEEVGVVDALPTELLLGVPVSVIRLAILGGG
jgi:hypothetical protein